MSHAASEVPSDALVALARACGISIEYRGHDGLTHYCSASAMRAALAALELDAETDDACVASLAELEDHVWRRIVPPITMVRQGETREFSVHVTDGDPVAVALQLEAGNLIAIEQLDRYVPPRAVGGSAGWARNVRVAGFAAAWVAPR